MAELGLISTDIYSLLGFACFPTLSPVDLINPGSIRVK
jgi:hypothetical protein